MNLFIRIYLFYNIENMNHSTSKRSTMPREMAALQTAQIHLSPLSSDDETVSHKSDATISAQELKRREVLESIALKKNMQTQTF